MGDVSGIADPTRSASRTPSTFGQLGDVYGLSDQSAQRGQSGPIVPTCIR